MGFLHISKTSARAHPPSTTATICGRTSSAYALLTAVEVGVVDFYSAKMQLSRRRFLSYFLFLSLLFLLISRPPTLTHRDIFVAVTVKDRINYVKLVAENFAWLEMSTLAEVHVFDNGSKQFSTADLKTWFPYASIHPLDTLQDPDMATRRAFEYFVDMSSSRILVNLDSDSLLHPEWESFVRQILPESSGVLSLYHTAAAHHPSFNCGDVTCSKNSTGALGLVFQRDLMKEVLENVVESRSDAKQPFDWAVCDYLISIGKVILVPRDSLVLHFGLHGANGDGIHHVEYDTGFNLDPFPAPIRAQVKFFLENKFVVD